MPVATSSDAACGDHSRTWLCHWVTNVTDDKTAAHVARYVSPWLSILLIALLAFIVNRIVRRIIKRSVRRWERVGRFTSERRHQRAVTIGAGLASFAAIVVWIVAVLWMLAVLGVSAATLLTSAGLLGVALAFGAQNLLRDLISGTFIIFEDQLGVGDVVDLGVASGTVEEVTLRTTSCATSKASSGMFRTARSAGSETSRSSGRGPWSTFRSRPVPMWPARSG